MDTTTQSNLRKISPFKMLTNSESDNIMMRSIETLSFDPDTIILKKGQYAKGVYIVTSGRLKLVSRSGDNELIVEIIDPDKMFGYEGMMSDKPSSEDVISMSNVKVLFIPRDDILFLCRHNNRFSLEMIKELCFKLERTRRRMAHFCYQKVPERIASAILYLDHVQEHDHGGYFIASRTLIGNLSATRRETATRIVKDYCGNGMVTIHKNHKGLIKVSDKDKLEYIKSRYRSRGQLVV